MVKRRISTLERMPIKRRTKKPNQAASTKFQKDRLSNRLLLGLTKRTQHSYVDYFALTPSVPGVPLTYQFSANGLFDPNISGTGHQPRGYDQLKSLFDHYQVLSSTIKVTACSLGPQTASFPVCFGVILCDDTTVESDQIHALEAKKSSWGVLPANDSSRTLYLDFDAKQYFGINWNDNTYRGSINANPDDGCFYQVFIQPMSSVTPAAVNFVVEIIYNVQWTEPNNVQIS